MRFGKAIEEVVLDHIDEIRRVVIILTAGHDAERRELGLLDLFRLDEAVLLHLVQHAIPGFGGALGTAIGGGITVGSADDAGKKGGLAQSDIANILIEIGQRAFRKAVNGEAAAVAQINLVGVELENLLLVEAMLEFHGDHGFSDLAAPGALGGKEEAP